MKAESGMTGRFGRSDYKVRTAGPLSGYCAFCGIMVVPVRPTPVNWTIKFTGAFWARFQGGTSASKVQLHALSFIVADVQTRLTRARASIPFTERHSASSHLGNPAKSRV